MNIWEKILGEPILRVENGKPILASGQPLTETQLRAIQPLLDEGVPEWSNDAEYAAAVDFERHRRNRANLDVDEADLLLAEIVSDIHAAQVATIAGDTAARDAAVARNGQRLILKTGIDANFAASAAALALTPRPTNYDALFDAFESALA